MISITIEIEGAEPVTLTAEQAIKLRDELNRLFAPEPQPIMPLPTCPSPFGDDAPWWLRQPTTSDKITIRTHYTTSP